MSLHLPHISPIKLLNRRANSYILAHPLNFTWQVLKAFRDNQGLLLAGAVAYYALLSIVPFLMQAMCFLAGANSIFYGDKLLTTDNPEAEDDRVLLNKLGLQTRGAMLDSVQKEKCGC